MMMNVSYAIIIPTLNAEPFISALLVSILQYDDSLREKIVIVDSESTDGTISILRRAGVSRIHSVPRDQFDHGGTRTEIAAQCPEDVLIFMTQDVVLVDHFSIKNLLSPLADPCVAAVYGRQLPLSESTLFASHLRLFNYPACSYIRTFDERSKYGIKTPFLSNSFAAYRRSALEEIGWFKNGMLIGEDIHAGGRLLMAGYCLAYAADACAYHAHNYNIFEEFGRYFDTGAMHAMEPWIKKTFGSADREGWRFLRSEWRYFLQNRAYGKIPEMTLRILAKYFGYKLGGAYKYIPCALLQRFSMHPAWWVKNLEHAKL